MDKDYVQFDGLKYKLDGHSFLYHVGRNWLVLSVKCDIGSASWGPYKSWNHWAKINSLKRARHSSQSRTKEKITRKRRNNDELKHKVSLRQRPYWEISKWLRLYKRLITYDNAWEWQTLTVWNSRKFKCYCFKLLRSVI